MTRRSTGTRRNHAKRTPPKHCAGCGAEGVRLYQDHVINLAAGGDDTPANMQWLCGTCHHVKSERERMAGLRAYHAKKYRQPEQHPGLTQGAPSLTGAEGYWVTPDAHPGTE